MALLLRRVFAVALVSAALLVIAGIATLATGRVGLVVTHGVSMSPLYRQGDLVVIVRADSYRPGQIVGYHRPGHTDLVLHRIVGGSADGFVFKGDNNQAIDPTRPRHGELAGQAVLHVPRGGLWLRHLTSPAGLALLTLTLLAGGGGAALATRTRRQRRRARMAKHATRVQLPRALGALTPGLQVTATVAAIVALAGGALTALAWTTPDSSPRPTPAGVASRVTFGYTAAVGRTAAYDTTTVTSPDPVFRKLTDRVTVTYTYTGEPGRISVAAYLSTTSGWRSTLSLSPPVTVGADPYRGQVLLDLTMLQARAGAAATAAGLPDLPLNIALTPSIQTSRGSAFTPALRLTMTAQQLALAAGFDDLTVTDARPPSTASETAPRIIGVYGVRVRATTARNLGVLLLSTALALMAMVGLRAARTPPGEVSDIRRRYAPLLLEVHPVTAAPHRPVIDVTAFVTLVKLAERYGLLILHWTRSDIDTFLVQDDASTYRYRVGDLSSATPSPGPSLAQRVLASGG